MKLSLIENVWKKKKEEEKIEEEQKRIKKKRRQWYKQHVTNHDILLS